MKKKLIGVLLAAVLLISALPVQAQSTEYTEYGRFAVGVVLRGCKLCQYKQCHDGCCG